MANFFGMGGYDNFGMGFGGPVFFPLMLLLVVWTLYWKFHALWYAAKHDHKGWFIAMMIINSLGILEILYLYYFSKQPVSPSLPNHDEKKVPMIPEEETKDSGPRA